MLETGDKADREFLEAEIERWLEHHKSRMTEAHSRRIRDSIVISPNEGLLRFMFETFSNDEILNHVLRGLLKGQVGRDHTNRQLIQLLIDAWLTLEENPSHDFAAYMASEIPKELELWGVRVDKSKELRRKKGEIANGLGKIDQERINFTLDTLKNSDDPMLRKGAARYLATLCTDSLRYYIDDPQNRQAVFSALTDARKDNDPSVRRAAKVGLKFLKRK